MEYSNVYCNLKIKLNFYILEKSQTLLRFLCVKNIYNAFLPLGEAYNRPKEYFRIALQDVKYILIKVVTQDSPVSKLGGPKTSRVSKNIFIALILKNDSVLYISVYSLI